MFVLLSQMVMSGLWNKKKNANRARMKEVICKYAYIDRYIYIYSSGDSHPCCAVLQDIPQLGFLGDAVCPSGLASI